MLHTGHPRVHLFLGQSAFVGVGIIPLNTVVAKTLKGMQEKQMKNRDCRTRLVEQAARQHPEVLVSAIRCPYRTNESPESSYMRGSTRSFIVSCRSATSSKYSGGSASSQYEHKFLGQPYAEPSRHCEQHFVGSYSTCIKFSLLTIIVFSSRPFTASDVILLAIPLLMESCYFAGCHLPWCVEETSS